MAKAVVRVCFYSPYFPNHFGGGERHILDIVTHLPQGIQAQISFPGQENNTIDLDTVRKKYEFFYGSSLKNIKFVAVISSDFLHKLWWSKQFSHLFVVSDGSLFFSLATRNTAHLQIPFKNYPDGFFNKLKLRFWQLNTNSYFTKSIIDVYWPAKVTSVLQPMVESSLFLLPQKKEKIILNVGRFFTQLHSKRQDVLIENFRQLIDKYPKFKDWKLVLVGSVEDAAYVAKITQASVGLPVTILTNCSRPELLELYAKASIYWHATGFGVDEISEPERVEHFGITTLEAMAASTVPLVVAKGGQREILGKDLLPLAWNTQDECIEQTRTFMADQKLLHKYQILAKKRASIFAEKRFSEQVANIFLNKKSWTK